MAGSPTATLTASVGASPRATDSPDPVRHHRGPIVALHEDKSLSEREAAVIVGGDFGDTDAEISLETGCTMARCVFHTCMQSFISFCPLDKPFSSLGKWSKVLLLHEARYGIANDVHRRLPTGFSALKHFVKN